MQENITPLIWLDLSVKDTEVMWSGEELCPIVFSGNLIFDYDCIF